MCSMKYEGYTFQVNTLGNVLYTLAIVDRTTLLPVVQAIVDQQNVLFLPPVGDSVIRRFYHTFYHTPRGYDY